MQESRNGQTKKKMIPSRKQSGVFPTPPKGYNPATWRIEKEEEQYSSLIAVVDGFKIHIVDCNKATFNIEE